MYTVKHKSEKSWSLDGKESRFQTKIVVQNLDRRAKTVIVYICINIIKRSWLGLGSCIASRFKSIGRPIDWNPEDNLFKIQTRVECQNPNVQNPENAKIRRTPKSGWNLYDKVWTSIKQPRRLITKLWSFCHLRVMNTVKRRKPNEKAFSSLTLNQTFGLALLVLS